MPSGSPIHLTATATVQSGSAGVGMNTAALRPPMDLPFEIHQIRFQLWIDDQSVYAYGNSIGCKLTIGEEPLTSGFVPVFLFGRGDADQYEYSPSAFPSFYPFEHTMRLARPLFLAPGQIVTPTFQHRGFFTQSINVRIGLVGKLLPYGTKPNRITYPYVCSYNSKSFVTYGAAADSDISTEKDLVNPFTTPLRIEHFTGRTAIFNTGALSNVSEVLDPDFALRYVTLTMRNSYGEQIIKDPATFGNVFHLPTRTWEMQHMLSPGQYYIVSLAKSVPTVPNEVKQAQAFVAMVGYREVQ